MDQIWMPFLEQSCMELIEQHRDGKEGRAQTAEQVGANKRQNLTGSQLEGEERTKLTQVLSR